MGTEQRRAPRTAITMTLTLKPRDSDTGQWLEVPVEATMVDMSVYGARLRLPHIQSGSLHLFYDFNDHPFRHLEMEIFDQERNARFIIAAHPVWFTRIDSLEGRPFELGMQFLIGPHDPGILRLKALSRRRSGGMGGWMRELFAGIWSGGE